MTFGQVRVVHLVLRGEPGIGKTALPKYLGLAASGTKSAVVLMAVRRAVRQECGLPRAGRMPGSGR